MSKRYLYLVRHAQYDLSKRDDGELTPRGQEQALSVALALREMRFTRIINSPILRAVQTADIIAALFPWITREVDERLSECIPAVPDSYREYFNHHYPDLSDDQMDDCAGTLQAFYREYFQPPANDRDEYVMIVCHGNVIRYLVSQALESDSRFWMRMLINNCGLSRISVDRDGHTFVISHNDIGHLPQHLLTEF